MSPLGLWLSVAALVVAIKDAPWWAVLIFLVAALLWEVVLWVERLGRTTEEPEPQRSELP